MGLTKLLIDILSGGKADVGGVSIDELLRHAADNKTLLHAMRALNVSGPLRDAEEGRFKRFLGNVELVSKALDGLNYSFFKLVKPLAYVPADIDVLIDASNLWEAVDRLAGLGLRVVVREPLTVTLGGPFIVDLYVHPNMGGVAYLDGTKLLRLTETVEFNGLPINSLPPYVEALMAVTHAVYKEALITANDYFTFIAWVDNRTIALAEELRCLDLLPYVHKVFNLAKKGEIELPFHVPLTDWVRLWFNKILNDDLTRSTLRNVFIVTYSVKRLKNLLEKFKRSTY